jgi:hypothetical protein
MPVMDNSTLHGLSLVLIVSASLTLPWLFATAFGRRRNFYSASSETIATARRALAHYGSWEAMEAAAVTGEDGIARVTLPPRTERED